MSQQYFEVWLPWIFKVLKIFMKSNLLCSFFLYQKVHNCNKDKNINTEISSNIPRQMAIKRSEQAPAKINDSQLPSSSWHLSEMLISLSFTGAALTLTVINKAQPSSIKQSPWKHPTLTITELANHNKTINHLHPRAGWLLPFAKCIADDQSTSAGIRSGSRAVPLTSAAPINPPGCLFLKCQILP